MSIGTYDQRSITHRFPDVRRKEFRSIYWSGPTVRNPNDSGVIHGVITTIGPVNLVIHEEIPGSTARKVWRLKSIHIKDII